MAAISKRQAISISAVGAVVILSIALWAFAPWTLFTNKTVDESLPSAAPSPSGSSSGSAATPPVQNTKLFSGPFQSYEHPTSGTAELIATAAGKQVVRLANFETSNGPDVRVWLASAEANNAEDADAGKHVDLGELKGNKGNQNYEVPQSASDNNWKSVVIWCDRFSVAFGAAPLNPPTPTPAV